MSLFTKGHMKEDPGPCTAEGKAPYHFGGGQEIAETSGERVDVCVQVIHQIAITERTYEVGR